MKKGSTGDQSSLATAFSTAAAYRAKCGIDDMELLPGAQGAREPTGFARIRRMRYARGLGGSQKGPMTSRTRPAHAATPADPDVEATPWIGEGILAGGAGAAVIAALFAVLDLAAGRPLWTPHALGAALFLGEPAAPGAPVSAALVGGYTVIHTWVFVSIGLLASFLLIGARLPGGGRLVRILVLAGALFLAFGVIFAAFAALLALGDQPPHGFGRILAANAVAALAMAALLVRRLERRRPVAAP